MNSYTIENVIKIHKPKCKNNDIITIRSSSESHLHWKKHFHNNSFFFKIYGVFEADNEKGNSSIGNKTTNFYKQFQVLNGYQIQFEMVDVLKSCYYISPLGYDNVDWFVNEVIKSENKMSFSFKILIKISL